MMEINESYWKEIAENLPNQWEFTSISEVFEVNPGHKKIEIENELEVSFIPMTSIYEVINKIDLSQIRPYKDIKSGFTKFIENDVLFAKITPCMENGKIAIAENLKNGIGCGTTELHVLRPIVEGTNKYLYYFLVQDIFRAYAKSKFNGAVGHLRVPTTIFSEKLFPLPPLAEQKRIVAKLDAAYEHLDTLKASLSRIPELLKSFRQAVLTQAVTGKLTEEWREENENIESIDSLLERISKQREAAIIEIVKISKENGERLGKKPNNIKPRNVIISEDNLPDTWGRITFEDISNVLPYSISSGPFGSALGTKDYKVTGIPVVRGQNVQPGKFINKGFVYITLEKANELKRSAARPGDIVLVAVGAGVGNAAVIPDEFDFGILSQNCNKFSLDQNLVIPTFIIYCLQVSVLKSQMDDFTTDTARQFLSLTNLRKILFQIPPFEEQQEIVRRVEALFAKADAIEAQYHSLKEKIDKLPQALLAKAFRGELVEQDATDEPAAVLLERIRTARTEGSKNKAGKTFQWELNF